MGYMVDYRQIRKSYPYEDFCGKLEKSMILVKKYRTQNHTLPLKL